MISTTLEWILTLAALVGVAGFALAVLAYRQLDDLRRELDVRNWYRDHDLPGRVRHVW